MTFMATEEASRSCSEKYSPTPRNLPAIDDDIQKTVESLLDSLTSGFHTGKTLQILQKQFQRTLQFERNLWKERLHGAMQEIDRQHRLVIFAHSALHDIARSLSSENSKLENEQADYENASLENLVHTLKLQILKLKEMAKLDGVENMDNISLIETDVIMLQKKVLQLQSEKENYVTESEQKEKEMKWLTEELQQQKRKLHKLNRIIKNYNETYIGVSVHLDDADEDLDSSSLKKEQSYTESDQLKMFPMSGEEIALWKVRLKQHINSKRKGNSIGQCLRCQKLFRPNENNSKACRFHQKGREVKEQYTTNGKLEKVLYKWACCKKGLDNPGCSYGYHI